jgi:hypothetical protein
MKAATTLRWGGTADRLPWGTPRPRGWDLYAWLLLLTVVVGCATLLITTELGSGDYGQWLMASRSYVGLAVPDYRADGAVPPVIPLLLGSSFAIIGDAILAIRLVTMLILAGLALSACAAGATLLRSRVAGLVAAVVALLVAGSFLELFAFGGLLQAAAIAWLWLSVAAFVRAGRDPGEAWGWWTLGALCVGLGALTHMGTASIAVPTGVAIAVLAAIGHGTGWRDRGRRLVSLGLVLTAVAIYWVVVLLPGSTDLAHNPASLAYRGPGRLLDAFTSTPTTALVAAAGLLVVAAWAIRDGRRRSLESSALAAWTAITFFVVAVAIFTGAATDYLRFMTPVLAPLVIGAAAALYVAVTQLARWAVARTTTGTQAGWSLAVVAVAIALATPAAVSGFRAEADGYRLKSLESVIETGRWIDTNLPADATVLAPAREAKWLEGLTGRSALFSNAVRYSFRAEEWQRSLAADTLMGSAGALVNEYFFARFADAGSAANDMRGLIVGANHGGEYVDLLSLVSNSTQVFSGSGEVLATVTNLALEGRTDTLTDDEATVVTAWSGQRLGASLSYHQAVTLRRDSSTLDIRAVASSGLVMDGIGMELRPSSRLPGSTIAIDGHRATITFPRLGSSQPRLLVTLGGDAGELVVLPGGNLGIRSRELEVRLLITDLTGAPSPSMGLQLLRPGDLVDRYHVSAVVLTRDPSFAARLDRMEALGFVRGADVGPYVVLVRHT